MLKPFNQSSQLGFCCQPIERRARQGEHWICNCSHCLTNVQIERATIEFRHSHHNASTVHRSSRKNKGGRERDRWDSSKSSFWFINWQTDRLANRRTHSRFIAWVLWISFDLTTRCWQTSVAQLFFCRSVGISHLLFKLNGIANNLCKLSRYSINTKKERVSMPKKKSAEIEMKAKRNRPKINLISTYKQAKSKQPNDVVKNKGRTAKNWEEEIDDSVGVNSKPVNQQPSMQQNLFVN